MERSEPLARILLFGGDGGRSGVPCHLGQICETLADQARLTIARDFNSGGYDGIGAACQIEIEGLRSTLRPWMLWRGWRGILNVLGSADWEVIWLHARLPALLVRLGLAAGLVRPRRGARIVLSYHGLPFDPGHRRLAAWLSLWLERRLLRHCPPMHLVFLGTGMQTRFCRAIGRDIAARHRLHVLPNSSNLGAVPAPIADPAARHLVVTGRAAYQKNYPLAARLMDHLPKQYVLTLCGAGTDAPGFQASIRRVVRRETRRRIRFAGQVADVRPLLAQADCYLLPSRYEGLPIGAIEAFEAGLPLVLAPFEAAADLVAAHPMALCLPLRDLPRDAVQITRLVEDYHRNRAVQSKAIRSAWRRTYSYHRWQSRLRDLMQEILAG